MSELIDGVTPEIKAVNPMACSYAAFLRERCGHPAKTPEGQRRRIERELDRLQRHGAFFELENVHEILRDLSAFDGRASEIGQMLYRLHRADERQLAYIQAFMRGIL